MARRILNRRELRADYEAAENRRPSDEDAELDEEELEDDEDDEEEDLETEEDELEGEDEEEEIKPKKKKKVAAPKIPKKPRSRVAKVTRMKVVWGVFNNSNQRVATFDYPKKHEAEELAAKLTVDKKNIHFIQPVKEPMEEKKEE
ncbi:MAG: hypothetical protein ACK4RK_14440 [Gemmataceae bacterium]